MQEAGQHLDHGGFLGHQAIQINQRPF